MDSQPSDLGQVIAILLRYRWFMLAALVVPLLAALAYTAVRSPAHTASAQVDLIAYEREPVAGRPFPITYFEYLSDDMRARVADRVAKALADEGAVVDAPTLLVAVSQVFSAPFGLPAVRRLDFTGSAGDGSTAIVYVNAWANAYPVEVEVRRREQADEQIGVMQGQAEAALAALRNSVKALNEAMQRSNAAAPAIGGELVEERSRVSLALARLKDLQARGNVGSTELQLALGDLFAPGSAPPATDLTTLVSGLGLRLTALDREIAAYAAGAGGSTDVNRLFAEVLAAQRTLEAADNQATAAWAALGVPNIEAKVALLAEGTNSRLRAFALPFIAAGIVGIGVGVGGALVLHLGAGQMLSRRRDSGTATAP